MPVAATALACEGERGMVNGDVGGEREKGYGKALVLQSASLISAPTLSLKKPVEKMSLIVVFWQGFRGPDGVNQVAKLSSI